MQHRVISELVKRYGNSYNRILFTGRLPPAVSEFLWHVSTFYRKLSKTPTPGSYVNAKANDVTEAFLECVPKFLAALYFLLYNVDRWFEAVGGGKWRYNYPGWESTWVRHFWQQEYGGRLQDYLRVSLSDKYGGLIPGGFGPEEVTYGYDYDPLYGYWYGESMVNDLQKILNKHIHKYNDFRDVFVTSVISKTGAGTHKVNTANVLALVRTFCEIVDAEAKRDEGKRLKAKLDTTLKGQNKCINWEQLKSHCSRLNSELEKLFKNEGFSYTGQARTVYELNTETFAEETAIWFRNNLRKVQKNVQQINKSFPVDDTRYLNVLQQFATKYIFPYGFIFGKGRYGTLGDAWKTLSDHWPGVIDMLGRDGDGLDMLKRILDGGRCPPPAPPTNPRLRPPPAPRTARPSGPARTSAVRTTNTRGGGSSSVGRQASGARGGGGHTYRGGFHGRGGVRGALRGRAQGPGTRAVKVVQRSRNTGHTMYTKPQPLQPQNYPQPHSQQPLPPAPSAPSSTSQPGAPGPTSSGSDVSGQQSGTSQDAARTQTPSASGSVSGSTGVQGAGKCGSGAGGGVGPSSGSDVAGGDPAGKAAKAECNRQLDAQYKTVIDKLKSEYDQKKKKHDQDAEKWQKIWDEMQEKRYTTLQDEENVQTHLLNKLGPQQTSSLPTQPAHPPSHSHQPAGHVPGAGLQTPQGPPIIDGQPPTDYRLGQQWPWLYHDLAHIPFVGVPVDEPPNPDDKMMEDLYHKNIEEKNTAGVKNRMDMLKMQAEEKKLIEEDKKYAENKLQSEIRTQEIIERIKERNERKKQAAQKLNADIKNTTEGMWETQLQQNVQHILNDVKDKDAKERLQHKIAAQQKKLELQEIQEPPTSPPSTLPSQPSRPDTGASRQPTGGLHGLRPINQRPYYEPQGAGGVESVDLPMSSLGGDEVPDVKYEVKQAKLEKEFRDKETLRSWDWQEKQEKLFNDLDKHRTEWDAEHQKYKDNVKYSQIPITLLGQPVSSDAPMLPTEAIEPPMPSMAESNRIFSAISRPKSPESTLVKVDLDPVKPSHPITDIQTYNMPTPTDTKEDRFDLRIDVPKLRLPDNDLDFALDIDDDSKHISNDTVPLPADPYIPEISFNLTPPEAKQLPLLPTDFDKSKINRPDVDMCIPDWSTQKPTHDSADIPETELFPSDAPSTVKDMLLWIAGLQNPKHQETLKQCINNAFKRGDDVSAILPLAVNGAAIRPQHVIDTIHLAAVFAASVIISIEPNWRVAVSSVASTRKDSDQSKDPDCCALLCQLRDYVYACCHQLAFLKSQCSRDNSQGGWQDCEYGSNVSSPNSPLQAFLTDAHDSKFKTDPFDPRDICLKSRINMGFREKDLPASQQTGKHISTILSPICGGNDPLLTLASYLNCLTRRTPRTTGELVSFFHNFGKSLHSHPSALSPLGSAVSTRHDDCPDCDILGDADLNALQDIRGSAPPSSNHDHDKDHPKTLSTLLGCGIDNAKCPQHLSPITYRAYALYSSSFVHHYLSWAAYLADRLWESLLKLHMDFAGLQCSDDKSFHQCEKALPLLYSHGFTPPEGGFQSPRGCSKLIDKLKEVVTGGPIANLMTCMDTFFYGIRAPFIYTVFTLWLIATLYILHSLLYRMDVLRIRSHLMRSKASHFIDVKALLTKGRKMLSLYRDVDYFDDDPMGQLGV
ncbi:Ribosome-binding protein 1 [Babesia ovata]|uniref:Ribosome-binding protein 1 n=1 Tax=Babesia ovata TaxID=189622 RepID=A0A2H6KJC4_9APIC|nr:Ribosome-binding protein 1 [Babesia ovata]GBE63088.1 Ribosome-binding protein 1 [Babesia ovata]